MKIRILLALTFLSLSIYGVGAQAAGTDVAREKEASDIARKFAARLLITKDLKPVVREFMVDDYLTRSLAVEGDEWGPFISMDVAKRLDRRAMERMYLLQANWLYLSMLYTFSKRLTMTDMNPMSTLPKDVQQAMDKIQDIPDPTENLAPGVPLRPAEKRAFDRMMTAMERAVSLLRGHAIRINAGRTRAWKTIMDRSPEKDYFKTREAACEGQCFGLAKGTMIYRVAIPATLELSLAEINGRLKIIGLRSDL